MKKYARIHNRPKTYKYYVPFFPVFQKYISVIWRQNICKASLCILSFLKSPFRYHLWMKHHFEKRGFGESKCIQAENCDTLSILESMLPWLASKAIRLKMYFGMHDFWHQNFYFIQHIMCCWQISDIKYTLSKTELDIATYNRRINIAVQKLPLHFNNVLMENNNLYMLQNIFYISIWGIEFWICLFFSNLQDLRQK